MTDRPASWRMPNPKEMDKMAALVGRNVPREPGLAPEADLPPEYWQALLDALLRSDWPPVSSTDAS